MRTQTSSMLGLARKNALRGTHIAPADNFVLMRLYARSAAAILAAVPLNKDSSSALEFASGTGLRFLFLAPNLEYSIECMILGLVAKDILPYVKDLVGIDISAALVERCNQRFKEEGAGEGSYAIAANIERDDGVLADRKFDLVYVSAISSGR